MVHNGVHNMGACFNGYFYNYQFTAKFQGGFMYFVVQRPNRYTSSLRKNGAIYVSLCNKGHELK